MVCLYPVFFNIFVSIIPVHAKNVKNISDGHRANRHYEANFCR